MCGQHLCIPPGLPTTASTFCVHLFYIWAQPGALCSSMLAFFQLAWLPAHWDGSFLCSEEAVHEDQLHDPDPFPSMKVSYRILQAGPWMSQNLLFWSPGSSLLLSGSWTHWSLNCCCSQSCPCPLRYPPVFAHLWVVGAPTEHFPHQCISHVHQENIFNTFQKPPGLVVPSHLALPTGWLKSLMSARACDWDFLQIPKECFTCPLFFIRWGVADTHCSTTCAGLSSDPYPQAHYWLITCPNTKLYAYDSFILSSTSVPSLPTPVFPASLHCSTPVTSYPTTSPWS